MITEMQVLAMKAKKRYKNKSVAIDVTVWDYSSGTRATKWALWIESVYIKTFNTLEELREHIDSWPKRDPILFRKFEIK